MREFDFEKIPIVEIVNEILLDGVKRGASDIHFDPTKEDIKIRMRVDGLLYDYAIVPQAYKRNIISRIKMIASMNIMETRLPQDGAIKSKIGDKILDLRVSSLPTHLGEKVVLRILDYSMSLQGLETLGFSETNYDKIIKMVEIPNGIVLVTGATGSGKSTTVYSILQKLNTREVNIITVEDPVEMDIAGINQVQAQSEIGLDFANVLRSILRQDPDVIMIGEIRDSETARIAVRASITGHKVLSTIHTNNALNTIERLTDMDVERYLIGTSLNGVISQKLARKLCPFCKKERPTTEYEQSLFKKVLHEEIFTICEVNPEGCEHCFKGYKNRIAIAEVLLITDEIRSAITNAESKEVMRKLVYGRNNTHTLLEDGLEKVALYETTFDEILKLVDLENDLAIHEANDQELGVDEIKKKQLRERKEKMLALFERTRLSREEQIAAANKDIEEGEQTIDLASDMSKPQFLNEKQETQPTQEVQPTQEAQPEPTQVTQPEPMQPIQVAQPEPIQPTAIVQPIQTETVTPVPIIELQSEPVNNVETFTVPTNTENVVDVQKELIDPKNIGNIETIETF